MPFEVPGARVSTSFPLMQTAALSRAVFAEESARNKVGAAPALPALNAKGFAADTEMLVASSPDMKWLKRNVIGISDAYIWPCRTFTIVIGAGGAPKVTGQSEVDSLSAADVDIKGPKSLFNWVASRKQAAYLPSTVRSHDKKLFCFERVASGDRALHQKAGIISISDDVIARIDMGSVSSRVAMHSKSMLLLPLMTNESGLGMMMITYARESLFGSGGQGTLSFEHITFMQHLAGATSVAMMNLHRAGKPLE